MHSDSDTSILERAAPILKPHKSLIARLPLFWITLAVSFCLVVAALVMFARGIQATKRGVMEATYVGSARAVDFARAITTTESVVTPPMPKFNHVIFRLGDVEIFRFTYRDDGSGQHYSFEVREGGP